MGFASEFLGLPGLRGYWSMGPIDASGNALDLSGQSRTLTYTGNPTYNVVTTYHAPYIDLDGTGDYLTRADESALRLIGTESYVASAVRGLTMGGYFWFDVAGGTEGCITKDNNSTQRSYRLYKASSNVALGGFSSDGSATTTVTSSVTLSTGTWYFLATRLTPGTEIAVFTNTTKDVNTTSIPATIFNSTSGLNVGGFAGTLVMNGRASNCFLCAMALSDALLTDLYNNTKGYYGL